MQLIIKEKLADSATVLQILAVLCIKHTSFYNYELIELIIDQFGSDDDKTELQKYLDEFRMYCTHNVFEVPASVLHPPQSDCDDPQFALKYLVEGYIDLHQVKSLCILVAEILCINSWDLHLLSIEKGCILLRFALSKGVAWKVLPFTPQQHEALSRVEISLISPPTEEFVMPETEQNHFDIYGSDSDNSPVDECVETEGKKANHPEAKEGLSENLSKDASNPVTLVERCRSNSDFTGYETWDSGFGSASAEVAEWTKFSKPLIEKHPYAQLDMKRMDTTAGYATTKPFNAVFNEETSSPRIPPSQLQNYEAEMEKAHSLIVRLKDERAEMIKAKALQAERIANLEAGNQRLTEQMEQIVSQLKEIKKNTTDAEKIQGRLDQELKYMETLLRQDSISHHCYDSEQLKQYSVLQGISLQHLFVDHIYSPETSTYWKVAKPIVNGFSYIAKQPTHLNWKIVRTFVRECSLMSKIGHPNVLQFIGVHFGKDKYDLSLVTEQLSFDLPTYLTSHPELHSDILCAMLNDISSGILYLHRTCSIILRNLKASSILIAAKHQAKISNFECACYINDDVRGEVLNIDTTYRAPETAKEKPEFSTSTDIFSMGVICLHVATQESPELPKSETTVPAACPAGQLELYKRRKWIDKIETKQQPRVSTIVKLCLSDSPASRPSAFYLKILLNEFCNH